jgi:hypothetical protein
MRKQLFILFIVLSFIAPSAVLAKDGKTDAKTTVTITKAEREMAEQITAEQLKDYLYFIASDAMGGRDTPSPGLDITAQFIALNLKRWGFKPAGTDGTFFQKMMVRKTSLDASAMKLQVGDKEFSYRKDFFRVGGTGVVPDAPLVFGKDGWMVKSKGIDAFKGIDVKDKIVVLYTPNFARQLSSPALPEGVTQADLEKEKNGIDWADPFTYAKMKGAKGVIWIAPPQLEGFWGNLGRFLDRGGMTIEGLGDDAGGSTEDDSMPILLANKDVAKAIFDGASADQTADKGFMVDKSGSLAAAGSIERIPTQNVVAIWEADKSSKVKDEMIALGAHYDHVGTRPNAQGEDKIWNGADDDGSGTVGVLAIAEALAKAKKRPQRSVLFVWHAGEEKGLLGAEYFNKYPTVDIKNVVAQLNIDMIGRSKKPGDTNPRNKDLSGPNEVYVIGSEMMSSTLGVVTKETNSSFEKLDYNLKYDDPKDTNRFFFRSDHFHYAKNGIPIVFWFTGVHEDYHGAGDHPDKIDYQKMEKIARTIFLTMWELTELKERPAVDKKLPPELTSRN